MTRLQEIKAREKQSRILAAKEKVVEAVQEYEKQRDWLGFAIHLAFALDAGSEDFARMERAAGLQSELCQIADVAMGKAVRELEEVSRG
jgi:hypothetical protein